MKAEQIEVYAACDTDDRGYAMNHLGYFLIAAAAAAYLQNNHSNLGGYATVQKYKALRIADETFLLREEISKEKIIEPFPSFVPINGFQEYIYSNGWDKSKYFLTLAEIEKRLISDKSHHSFRSVVLFRDDEKFYILEQKEAISLAKFIESREIATAHALSKLTEEEKKLLGLA